MPVVRAAEHQEPPRSPKRWHDLDLGFMGSYAGYCKSLWKHCQQHLVALFRVALASFWNCMDIQLHFCMNRVQGAHTIAPWETDEICGERTCKDSVDRMVCYWLYYLREWISNLLMILLFDQSVNKISKSSKSSKSSNFVLLADFI